MQLTAWSAYWGYCGRSRQRRTKTVRARCGHSGYCSRPRLPPLLFKGMMNCSLQINLAMTRFRVFLNDFWEKIMRFMGIGLPVLAILSFAVLPIESASAAGSPAFCGTWLKLCNKTCPGGPGTCGGVCSARHKACLSSGCFHFNTPGPRCQSNALDETATAKVKTSLREGRPVGCGPNFGGRPCD